MGLAEHIQQIKGLITALPLMFSEFSEIAANDMLESCVSRIQQTGKDNEGKSLKPYSKGYLAFKKDPKGTNPERARKLGIGSSRYTGKVDYTLTGRMFNNIRVSPVQISDDKFVVSLGAQNDETNEKLFKLSKRDGFNPLEPSEDEKAEALADMKVNIQNRIIQLL